MASKTSLIEVRIPALATCVVIVVIVANSAEILKSTLSMVAVEIVVVPVSEVVVTVRVLPLTVVSSDRVETVATISLAVVIVTVVTVLMTPVPDMFEKVAALVLEVSLVRVVEVSGDVIAVVPAVMNVVEVKLVVVDLVVAGTKEKSTTSPTGSSIEPTIGRMHMPTAPAGSLTSLIAT